MAGIACKLETLNGLPNRSAYVPTLTSYLNPRVLRIGILFVLIPLIAGWLVSPKSVTATLTFSDSLSSNSINTAVWNDQIIGIGPFVVAANQTTIVTLP